MTIRLVRRVSAILLVIMLLSFGADCRAAAEREEDGWHGAFFDEKAAEEIAEGMAADLSHLPEGYAAFRAKSGEKLKIQLLCGEQKYNCDLPGDEKAVVCPLNMGSGA